MSTHRTTITDIATAAGMSKTTVSRYINGKGDMLSEDARRRIEKAIQIAHYRPSAIARSLKTQQSFLVGVVVANITTPFATSLLNGISTRLQESGYIPIFTDACDSPDWEDDLVESLIAHQIDGLIVNTTTSNNPGLISLSTSGTPVVLVDRFVDDHAFDIALSSYREPTLELMGHLHDEGFAFPVLLTESFENNSARSIRRDAFLEGSRTYFGRKRAEDDVYVIDPWEAGGMRDTVAAILGRAGDGGVPAFFATNTVVLIAAYNALHGLGVSIPGQAGLCGPDDWGWAHRMGWDWTSDLGGGVTTFATDPYAMGFAAADLMVRRIAEPARRKETRTIPTHLVVRASTMLKDRGERASLAEGG